MKISKIGGISIIAITITALSTGFVIASGGFGHWRKGSSDIVNALEYNSGVNEGYRRAHAKGVCVSGDFIANGDGQSLSKASQLQAGTYSVIGRLSTAGGKPFAPDGRLVFRSLALSINGNNNEIWRMALDHTPIFPVATPEDFIKFQIATKPDPNTKKPVPEVMKEYLKTHPETKAFQKYMQETPLPDSFATGTYYSINAFKFVNSNGQTNYVRWEFVPEAQMTAMDKDKLSELAPDFLFNEFATRLSQAPVAWNLIITIANPNDVTNNATVQWVGEHKTINAGRLVINGIFAEENGKCRDIVFDPTILPNGIEISDDPLLGARSASYLQSYRKRANEGAKPSAFGKILNNNEVK